MGHLHRYKIFIFLISRQGLVCSFFYDRFCEIIIKDKLNTIFWVEAKMIHTPGFITVFRSIVTAANWLHTGKISMLMWARCMERKTNVLHVCEYFRESDSSSEALATLLSSASAFLLNSLSLSLSLSDQTSTVCLFSLFGLGHFSHICRLLVAATKAIPACAYSITEGSWGGLSSVCALLEAFYWHYEAITSISWDLWCLILSQYMGPALKRGTPHSEIPRGLFQEQFIFFFY